eukprot:4940375-Pyramimonas_sp.AAC.1
MVSEATSTMATATSVQSMIEDAQEMGEWARAKTPQVLGELKAKIGALSVALRDNALAHLLMAVISSPAKAAHGPREQDEEDEVTDENGGGCGRRGEGG